jgi:hypothetical protein
MVIIFAASEFFCNIVTKNYNKTLNPVLIFFSQYSGHGVTGSEQNPDPRSYNILDIEFEVLDPP